MNPVDLHSVDLHSVDLQSVDLSRYDNSWFHPGGSLLKRAAWFFLGQPLLRSMLIPSSSMRVVLLRIFGARIGCGVTVKPGVDVKYPWHLQVGDHCWIGERCWIDNLTTVHLGSHVCISQGAYLCTGNHNWSDAAFGLRIAPIRLGNGSWAGAKSILTPGAVLGEGAVAGAGSVVSGIVPDWEIHAGNPARYIRKRTVSASSTSLPQQELHR